MWNKMDQAWEPDRRMVLLYNDGSGAVLVQSCEDRNAFIDDSGDYGLLDLADFCAWSYLPDDFRLWHERDDAEADALDPEVQAI